MFCLNKQEQKKVQEQPHAEQDTVFSTRPSPARPVSAKKPVGHELATEEPMEHQTGVSATRNDIKTLQIQFMLTKKLIHFELDRQMEKNVASSMHT
ncbi:BnaCnng29180D [Brassica napus]|uniref:BnaCnng29180D protein n=1 Tax=Brassica napus TaxID=3708 RepID=A0A078IZ75_BRANA|nr:BnaCnng29180D [Brassica napus]